MTDPDKTYCRVEDKKLRLYIYTKKTRIIKLEKALRKIIQKFKTPLYNGDVRQYETFDEIAKKALEYDK